MTSVQKGFDILLHNQYNIDLTFSRSGLLVFVLAVCILIPILFLSDEY